MIYIFSTSINSEWTSLDETLIKFVSPKRQYKIKRIKSEPQKKLTLYSALLTRMELCKLLNLDNSMLNFENTPLGKPICTNKNNINFSFSHTNGYILLAISEDEIGADVELIRESALNVAKKVCTAEELSYIKSHEADNIYKSFFNIWTKKEAYAKFLGTGLSFDLRKFNTLSPNEETNFLTWTDQKYICSIYSKNIGDTTKKCVSPKEIRDFFIS